MQAIRRHQLDILTKGQKAAIKSEAQKQQIEAEKSHKDQVMKAAIAFINQEVSENLIRDMVENFSEKGYASYNYYVDTSDFEAELPGGVIELPKDLETPTHWDRETKSQVPIKFTINRALRTKSLREHVQKILDEDFPGFSIRIFAEDFQNEDSYLPEDNRIIPGHIQIEVYKRDKGQCVKCGSKDHIHLDHIIPFSKGGTSKDAKNIQLLCRRHNLKKSDKVGG